MTIEDIYRELQEHLDELPIGYPATDSGVELRILKHFFSPEEARIAKKLGFMPETIENIYPRIKESGLSIEELEQKLEKMFKKGSINRYKRTGESGEIIFYSNALLAIGMLEYKLKDLSKDFCEDFEQYMLHEGFLEEMTLTKIPQFRTIPLNEEVTFDNQVATYDDVRKIIESVRGRISLAECICRKGKDELDRPCKVTKLREICMQFDMAADLYIDKGFSREISKEEASKILKVAEKDGLVVSPGNAIYPPFICLCCGCCCEYLGNKKTLHKPIQYYRTNYYAKVDPEECTGCGTCIERCQMDALTLIEDISTVDRDRCIGCGICVPPCPSGAIKLEKLAVETVPPKNMGVLYANIMQKKRKLKRKK